MNYNLIKTDRQFKAATAHSKSAFFQLVLDAEMYYKSTYGRSYEDYLKESVTEEAKFQDLGTALFFTLFQMKNDLTWDVLGLVFGLSRAGAHDNFERFSLLLAAVLEKKSDA